MSPAEAGRAEPPAIMQSASEGNSKPAMSLAEAVWVDPGRMSGTPCFRGTRVPVEQLFDWLADGVGLDAFLEEFEVDRRAAEAVLRTGCSAVCNEAVKRQQSLAMSNEPGTAGKFAAKLAARDMEPIRKYFRERNRAS